MDYNLKIVGGTIIDGSGGEGSAAMSVLKMAASSH